MKGEGILRLRIDVSESLTPKGKKPVSLRKTTLFVIGGDFGTLQLCLKSEKSRTCLRHLNWVPSLCSLHKTVCETHVGRCSSMFVLVMSEQGIKITL